MNETNIAVTSHSKTRSTTSLTRLKSDIGIEVPGRVGSTRPESDVSCRLN
jgi:hypothetical protein